MDQVQARKRTIYRVTLVGFVVNLALAVGKLAAGIAGRSGAMVADAVHSFSDLATDVVVVAFARISAKPRDEDHDYGHGKYETLATILISLALAAVGAGILVSGIDAIRTVVDGGVLPRPGLVALLAAAVSIAAKEVLYRGTRYRAAMCRNRGWRGFPAAESCGRWRRVPGFFGGSAGKGSGHRERLVRCCAAAAISPRPRHEFCASRAA